MGSLSLKFFKWRMFPLPTDVSIAARRSEYYSGAEGIHIKGPLVPHIFSSFTADPLLYFTSVFPGQMQEQVYAAAAGGWPWSDVFVPICTARKIQFVDWCLPASFSYIPWEWKKSDHSQRGRWVFLTSRTCPTPALGELFPATSLSASGRRPRDSAEQ